MSLSTCFINRTSTVYNNHNRQHWIGMNPSDPLTESDTGDTEDIFKSTFKVRKVYSIIFIGIGHIFKYIIENWVWLCWTLSRTRVAAFSWANLLVIGAGPLWVPLAGWRPQKYFRSLGWGHNSLQPSHSSSPPEAELQDWAISPGDCTASPGIQ